MHARATAAILLAGILTVASAVEARAAGFVVRDARVSVVNEIYMVDADIDYDFSDETLEALDSGVDLTVNIEVEFKRRRPYLWDPRVARVVQDYRLERHELTEQYLLVDVIAGTQRNFRSLDEALDALGQLSPIPVIERRRLAEDEAYRAQIRTRLDIEALPAPMRPVAYISPSWRLGSGWYSWNFEP